MSKPQITAEWSPSWRGGYVKISKDGATEGRPIAQAQVEMLSAATEAIGTQWLIDNCVLLSKGDSVVHTGKPPWRPELTDKE